MLECLDCSRPIAETSKSSNMSDCRGTTSPASGDGGTPLGAVQGCGGSEILVIDELGLPLAGVAVTVRPSSGSPINAGTDSSGKVCLNLPPGSSVQVDVGNIHETAPGDSITTPSGTHFRSGGTGP